ncbi:hypothetical protein GQ43DRAFT_439903 [Delitschia confertaspora ATCC 74209]|uniref:Uncharacterized protein n=1 Tax=Delitschia confertaspora ATCC 74209 TaxID=1513339 RepID=A0A9P4JS41_9PLEO|nr:hypothetical protein GQ43DRAFT_439903 [Delitschia confertaspora ATCC 74209]
MDALAGKNPLLLTTAVVHGLISLGHTTKGLEQFKHVSLNQLPRALRGAVTTGWYEGSVFFAIMSLLNYKWSTTGLTHPIDKTVASLVSLLYIGAGINYFRTGDKPSFAILSVAGLLQAWGVKAAM